jgi:hypothetical protein
VVQTLITFLYHPVDRSLMNPLEFEMFDLDFHEF